MIWISFDTWNSKHGRFLSWYRIYRKGKQTPFCRVEKRYKSWLGFWKQPEPDWKISVPDGRTASVTYKGEPLKVLSAHLDLQADAAAVLTLEVWAQHTEAVMDTLDIEIRTIPEGELHVDTIRKSQ